METVLLQVYVEIDHFSPLAGEELMETPTRLLQSKPPPALLLYNEFLEEKELDVDELRSRNLIDDIVE